MATIRLTPSTYSLSNTSYLAITNPENMYANCDSETYATVQNNQTGTTSYYLYIKGFNFDAIPSNAEVTSFTIKFKAYESGVSTSTSYRPYICNNTTTLTCSCNTVGTSAQTISFTGVSDDWNTIKGYGSNFGIRINCRRASRNTTGYMYVYGAEIEVNYRILVGHTVTTSTTDSDITISPSGSTTAYEGDSFELIIDSASNPNVTDNGVDVTDQLTERAKTGTISSVISAYTTSGSISGTYYQSAVGKGSDATATTNNNYCSTSGSTADINYTFNLSSVPSGADIVSVSCAVKGHLESTSASTEVAKCQLYSGTTAKGSSTSFTSTTDAVINLDTGTWTRSELDNLILKFTIGYYGGNVSGATLSVTYSLGDGTFYVYTIADVTEDHTIVVSAGAQSVYYTVTSSITNGTLRSTNPVSVRENSSTTIEFVGNDGFDFSSMTVNGIQVTPIERTQSGGITNGISLFHCDNSTSDELGNSTFTNGGSFSTTSKFGTHSIALNGSQYITIGLPQSYSPITVECWFNCTQANASGSYPTLFSTNTTASSGGTYMHIDDGSYGTTTVCRSNAAGGSGNTGGYGSTVISRNTWHHFAYCRDGSSHYFFVDGNLEYTVTQASPDAITTIYLGTLMKSSGVDSSCYMTGYIDEILISDTCKWNSSFTPGDSQYTTSSSTYYTYTISSISSDTNVVIVFSQGGSKIYLKENGSWQMYELYKKINGVWVKQQADPDSILLDTLNYVFK